MAVFIISFLFVAAIIATGCTIGHFQAKKDLAGRKTAPVLTTAGLSEVARQVHKEYMRLPEDSRPFPEIVSILKGLDAKTSVDAVDRKRHFDNKWLPITRVQQSGYEFTWRKDHGCSHESPFHPSKDQYGRTYHWGCRYHEYWLLHTEIKRVQNALDEKQRVLLASENEDATDMASQLVEALRSEAKIQRQTTRELT